MPRRIYPAFERGVTSPSTNYDKTSILQRGTLGRPFVKRYINDNGYRGNGDELSMLLDTKGKVLALAKLNMLWRSLEKLGPAEVMGTYVRIIDEGRQRA